MADYYIGDYEHMRILRTQDFEDASAFNDALDRTRDETARAETVTDIAAGLGLPRPEVKAALAKGAKRRETLREAMDAVDSPNSAEYARLAGEMNGLLEGGYEDGDCTHFPIPSAAD